MQHNPYDRRRLLVLESRLSRPQRIGVKRQDRQVTTTAIRNVEECMIRHFGEVRI